MPTDKPKAPKPPAKSSRKPKVEVVLEPPEVELVNRAARISRLKRSQWLRREVLSRAEAVVYGKKAEDVPPLEDEPGPPALSEEDRSWKDIAIRLTRVLERFASERSNSENP